MDTNIFLTVLSAVLLLPLIPAFLLYRFLPSKTSVAGPFKGLSVKLTGAFGGYFLLVLISTGLFFPILKNDQAKQVKALQEKLDALNTANASTENWKLHGVVVSSSPKETNLFFDKQGASFEPTGEFVLNFNCEKNNGKAALPKSVCVFNRTDGYKVVNLSREFNGNKDITDLAIKFDDSTHLIDVGNVIDIQSKEHNRVAIENDLLQKIKTRQVDVMTYNPLSRAKLLAPVINRKMVLLPK
jgi:hypothetical protein